MRGRWRADLLRLLPGVVPHAAVSRDDQGKKNCEVFSLEVSPLSKGGRHLVLGMKYTRTPARPMSRSYIIECFARQNLLATLNDQSML